MASRSSRRSRLPALFLVAGLTACAANPRLVDHSPTTGFGLYRSGWLTRAELAELCRQGLEELVVLDGAAANRECRWRDEVCPDLVVRYDRRQQAKVPVDAAFLAAFDGWIEKARIDGKKIAFRCRRGWHRAGRLGAWYRMRFSGWTAEEAIEEMLQVGRVMWRHPTLAPQVEALEDHLDARPCDDDVRHCVRPAAENAGDVFETDVCP